MYHETDPFEEARLRNAEDGDGRDDEQPVDVAGEVAHERQRQLDEQGVPDFRGPGDLADPNRHGSRVVDSGPVELKATGPATSGAAPALIDLPGGERITGTFDGEVFTPDDPAAAGAALGRAEQVVGLTGEPPADIADRPIFTGQRTAFDLAEEHLLTKFGTLDVDELRARGADDVEIGAAANIAGRAAKQQPAEQAPAIDPAAPAAIILAQVLALLDENGAAPVDGRQLAADIRSALLPMNRLVTADVLLRTNGEQFDARIDGGLVPWPLYLDKPLQVRYLPGNGLAVVDLPIIAHRVRIVDERGEQQAARLPGEPDENAAVDLRDKMTEQQQQGATGVNGAHRSPWPGGQRGRKGGRRG